MFLVVVVDFKKIVVPFLPFERAAVTLAEARGEECKCWRQRELATNSSRERRRVVGKRILILESANFKKRI